MRRGATPKMDITARDTIFNSRDSGGLCGGGFTTGDTAALFPPVLAIIPNVADGSLPYVAEGFCEEAGFHVTVGLDLKCDHGRAKPLAFVGNMGHRGDSQAGRIAKIGGHGF